MRLKNNVECKRKISSKNAGPQTKSQEAAGAFSEEAGYLLFLAFKLYS